jgi:hypothetical protein
MIKDIEIDKLNMRYFDGMHELEPKCKLTLPFPVYPSLRHGACPAVGQGSEAVTPGHMLCYSFLSFEELLIPQLFRRDWTGCERSGVVIIATCIHDRQAP